MTADSAANQYFSTTIMQRNGNYHTQ